MPPRPISTAFLAVAACLVSSSGFSQALNTKPVIGEPGPWGRIESYEVVLEPSNAVLANNFYRMPLNSWAFPLNWTPEQLETTLTEAEIPMAEISAMLAPGALKFNEVAQWIVPTETAILSLSPENRERFYQVLGQWEFNPYHITPFAIGADTISNRALMGSHSVPQELIDLADSLTYGKSPYRFFSDYPLICTKLPNETARIEFAKVLLRNRTLMARLRPSPKLDRDAMRNYWSVKGKNDGALPLLESITGPGSVEPVDITYLLPPLPRRFLYTYGTREMAVGRDLPDCFWSSLNFFQQEISNRFLDPVVGEILEKEWLPVEPPYQLGDLILIMRVADKEAVHACSYIADDIVFTKNGKSIVRPWVLQRIDDIKHTYYEEGVHSFTVRRHRSLIPRNKATPAAVISAR
ncbi:MAG: hypothetical protein KDL87_06620 [Verrucomicrobiae bacterium]|nr:hypothetical protein [Verrucomicrobiae bacterium]